MANWGTGPPPNRSNPVQVLDGSGNPLSGMVGISAGSYYTVYLKRDGTVWAVGYNSSGQLGDGTTTNRTNPVPVLDGSGNPLSGVVGISAGGNHTVYLQGDGTVWATGSNTFGQLGDGTTTTKSQPGAGGGWIGQSAERGGGDLRGNSHTVYLKGDGTVWAAGYNGSGQLGDGTTTNEPTRCRWWTDRAIR